MTDAAEMASLYPELNGLRLIHFSEVALPVFRLTVKALVHEKQPLPVIHEFVLRTVDLGYANPVTIAGLLGLSESVVKEAITELIRSDMVYDLNGEIVLTAAGAKSSKDAIESRPYETRIVLDVDGLTRKVVLGREDSLLRPKEAKENLVTIRPIPVRKPQPEELDLGDMGQYISENSKGRDALITLLRVNEIDETKNRFYPGVILIYKDEESDTYDASFCLDGKLSEVHGSAFAKSNGLERLGILATLRESEDVKLAKSEYPAYSFIPKSTGKKQVVGGRISPTKRIAALSKLKKSPPLSRDDDKKSKTAPAPKAPSHRPLPVHEHAEFLVRALSDARERVVIISPWITQAVVNRKFLERMELKLRDDVEIYIGYGMGGKPNPDDYVVKGLEALRDSHKNFCFKYLGDTHAKILMQDTDWYVVSSFNWLSFRGDPNRTYREEWGHLIMDPQMVSQFFETELKARFHN